MKEINLNEWYRKDFYEFYSKDEISRYSTTTNLDITEVYKYAKKNNISFYFALQYIFHTAVRDIEEFRIRAKDNKLFVCDSGYASCTYLCKGEEMYKIVDNLYNIDLIQYCKKGKEIATHQKVFFVKRDIVDIECIFSCIPWLSFTNIENPKTGSNDDFVPRIIWDKIKRKGLRRYVNVSIEVNHRVVDGLLISKLFDKVKLLIKDIKKHK